jgi:hypothetical protein
MHMVYERSGEIVQLIFLPGPIYLLNPIFHLLNHLFSTILIQAVVVVIVVVVMNVT